LPPHIPYGHRGDTVDTRCGAQLPDGSNAE
jgi:hypothetical protein